MEKYLDNIAVSSPNCDSSSSCHNSTNEYKPPEEWSLILGMSVTAFVMVVGSLGNLLTLCTVGHQFSMPRRYRYIKNLTPDTVLITNLAVADLFYSSINLPFVFVTYWRLFHCECPWPEGSNPCAASAFLRYTNAISEWMTLGLMALERCICIYKYRSHQSRGKWFTQKKTIIYCILIWVFGMTCQMPTLLGHFGRFGYSDDFVKCDFTENQARVVFFALESMVPCIIILIGYIIILCQVYSSSHILSAITMPGARRHIDLRRSRTTKVIILLLFVYLVCVIPLCGYNIAVRNTSDKHKELGIVIYCLYWCQYFINNFIYVVSNEKYRNAYWQFLALITCREIPKNLPTRTQHVVVRPRERVFHLSGTNHLPVTAYRIRTISEYEEKRLAMLSGDYEAQQNSRASSLSFDGCDFHSCPLPPSSSNESLINLRRCSLPLRY